MKPGITERGVTERWDDVDMLIPSVKERVIILTRRLTAMGFDPKVHETYRTRERAQMLARKGTGIVDSMHLYGVAADIICGDHQWDCARHGCEFFHSVGEQAKRVGLTWGGDWKKRDFPHVQGPPVSKQGAIRKAKDQAERDAICSSSMGPVIP